MTKETLRQHYKSLRASLDTEAVADQSLAIANQVLQLPIWEYTNYHIFLPIENKIEVDTSYLLSVLHGKDKSVILSKSNFDTHTMQHILLQENTRIALSKFGIPEPQLHCATLAPLWSLDLILVPLVAFDRDGNRIGMGGGFYDRTLASSSGQSSDATLVGLAHQCQEIASISHQSWDIPLHKIATNQEIICARQK